MSAALRPRPACTGQSLEQELLDMEDWRPLTDAEFHAWVAGELEPAPNGQIYGVSPCGIAVIYREESLESAVMSLHGVGARGILATLLDSPEADQLHSAARVDVCIAMGDRERALRALEADVPWAREYVLDVDVRPWKYQSTWQWAGEIARILIARQEAVAALDGVEAMTTA